MSIHVKPNAEAEKALQQQKRNSTILSMVTSVLVVTLVALLLGIFLLPNLVKESPVIVTYSATTQEESKEVVKKVQTNPARKPSAPSSSMAKVIAANATSPVSIPVPDVSADVPSVDYGSGDDFGTGWEGNGFGAGGGSMFGSSTAIPGALRGRLYDLKQSRSGRPISYDSSAPKFANIAKNVERRRFTPSAFSDYFEAPTELSLTNLAIPFSSASLGPEYFGAKDSIQPSGWIAAYHGRIAAPEAGRYRFRAAADDFLVALVNSRRYLVACYPDLHPQVLGDFANAAQQGSTRSPLGDAQLHAGEWISMKPGQVIEISLAIGERPGGMVGFVLEVEKEGETYRTAPDGRKILPLFTTHPFTDEERNEIQGRFGGYEFEWEKVPVFGIR
ncbi:MAG: hypothetical protein RLZZ505_2945 [Verrucomicrobiota bacterium]|jgi:hypothetical protein